MERNHKLENNVASPCRTLTARCTSLHHRHNLPPPPNCHRRRGARSAHRRRWSTSPLPSSLVNVVSYEESSSRRHIAYNYHRLKYNASCHDIPPPFPECRIPTTPTSPHRPCTATYKLNYYTINHSTHRPHLYLTPRMHRTRVASSIYITVAIAPCRRHLPSTYLTPSPPHRHCIY